jgi:hypothetical protein
MLGKDTKMALQARLWVAAGSLLLALAQSASAQSLSPGDVLDVPISTRLLMTFQDPSTVSWDLSDLPVSTRLLMTFHDRAAGPWYRSDIPMSTRLLQSFHSGPAAIPGRIVIPYGSPLPFPAVPEFSAPGGMAPARSAP